MVLDSSTYHSVLEAGAAKKIQLNQHNSNSTYGLFKNNNNNNAKFTKIIEKLIYLYLNDMNV